MKHRILDLIAGIMIGAVLFGGGVAYATGVMAEYAPQRVYVDGAPIQLEAYNIDGYNYVKLRDVGQVIDLFDLEPGTYLVQEIATDDAHVVNSTPQQIELKAGDTQTRELVFFNSLKPGIHLIKVDSTTMKSLPNVRFEFKLVGGSYRQEMTTDINGEIDLSKLDPGTYEVRELEAPDGYLMDDAVRVVKVDPDGNANFVFTNTRKPSFRLIKTSSDGTPLAGVHFRIAKIEDGSRYLDRITDDKGEINMGNRALSRSDFTTPRTDSSSLERCAPSIPAPPCKTRNLR